MDDASLRELGVHRIPIPVPFLHAGGPVNVYLVEERGGGVFMFDSGLGTPQAVAALEEGFRRAGRRFEDVSRIVVSHGHVDHYGGALSVIERAQRDVLVQAHAADVPKIAESGRSWAELAPRYEAHLARLGVPAGALPAITREVGLGFALARRLPEVTPVQPGAVIAAGHLSLEVHHMPGHTPGLICLYDARSRLLFSSDHLLEKVSPNPIIELGPDGGEGRFRPLVSYLESASHARALDVELVLPGHGPPFAGHRSVIDGLLSFYAKRQARLRDALARGPLTGYELTRVLFPWARTGDLFLTVSETIANLEVLELRGAVTRHLEDGVYLFHRLGDVGPPG